MTANTSVEVVPAIEAFGVTRVLPGLIPVTLVDKVSLSVNSGELVVINGPSGSGKSSLLYLLGLLDQPSSGEIVIDGIPTSRLSASALAKIRLSVVGFVFQLHFLLPEFTALDNVSMPMFRLGAISKDAARTRAMSLLNRFGLEKLAYKFPKQLSGGQSQRVALARCLANEPKVILADEPTGSLDTKSGSIVQETLRELATANKCAVVVVSHDQAFGKLANRVISIVDGKLV